MKNISLKRKYTNWVELLSFLQLIIIGILLVLSLVVIIVSGSTFILLTLPFLTLYSIFKLNQYFKNFKTKVKTKYFVLNKLLYFIQANKLYEEDYHEYEVTDQNGRKRFEKEKYVVNSAMFSYHYNEEGTRLIVIAHKNADNFTTKMSQLEEALRSLFGLDIEQILDRNTHVEYHMIIEAPERLNLELSETVKYTDDLDINLGYGVTYNPVQCPHILVSGGTGSGKSLFTSFLLLEFLKRKSTVYICDPKNSDLGGLSHYLGDEKVATSPNNIARVVRLAVTEMNERYKFMNENFKYGSNASEHGYKPIWLIFDEMGAFQASGTDKESKKVVNEVMDGLKQIILLGRQAHVFVLIAAQQMRSETLSTDLRDNLGLRIILGNNSQENYKMVLGAATPETIPPIEVKGSGLLYKQGSGTSTKYYESPYVDMQKFDFIEELKKYL